MSPETPGPATSSESPLVRLCWSDDPFVVQFITLFGLVVDDHFLIFAADRNVDGSEFDTSVMTRLKCRAKKVTCDFSLRNC